MYKTYFLKFTEKDQWEALAHLLNPLEVDVVGVLHTDFVLGADGEVLSGGEPIPGWHVNVNTKCEVPEELVPYLVTPETPERVFA